MHMHACPWQVSSPEQDLSLPEPLGTWNNDSCRYVVPFYSQKLLNEPAGQAPPPPPRVVFRNPLAAAGGGGGVEQTELPVSPQGLSPLCRLWGPQQPQRG